MSVGVFEYQVAYVESLDAFEPVLADARRAGVLGLAVKLYEASGSPFADDNRRRLLEQGDRYRGAGFKLGLWGCPRFAPEEAAAACSSLYRELRLAFAVFETEWEYKTDGGGVDVERLLAPWRRLRPFAYTACAVEGGPPTTFNHDSVQRHGVRLLPENYWLYDAGYDTVSSFTRCRALGYDLRTVHPTLTGVEGHGMAESIIRAYRARPAGFVRGVALWRGDMLSAEDYRLVGLARDLALR